MKNFSRRLSLIITIILLLCACSTNAEDTIDVSQLTPEQIAELQAQIDAMAQIQNTDATSLQILEKMIAANAPIDPDKMTDFDETTDVNGLLGTPGSYTSKTDYGCFGYAKDTDGYWVGGTLEVFENDTDARSRFDYLISVYKSMPVLLDCRVYLRGNAVLRISVALSNDEANSILGAFESIVPGDTETFNHIKAEEPKTQETGSENIQQPSVETHTASEYTSLSKGDKGAAVVQLQSRLKDLGFLNDVADGAFGGNTEKAVLSFQQQNNLDATGIATPEDQVVLFSAGVISASGEVFTAYDPYAVCPAEISRVALKSSYGFPYVTFSITNKAATKIEAITYEIQFFDAYGDRLSGFNGAKFEKKYAADLNSGKSASISTKDEYEMYDYEGVNYVAVAITRVLMADGTDLAYSDPVWFEGK